MNITPIAELIASAEQQIKTLLPQRVAEIIHEQGVVICDIRDIRELWQNGKISGARHAPRGMLEFWADPQSPYHKDYFIKADRLILYCAVSWRSALAAKTLQDMGFDNVYHIGGGYEAWLIEHLPIETVSKK